MFKILRRHPPGGATVGSSLAFDPADYERIVVAAAIEELTPTEFISDVALLALDLPGDIATPPSIGAMPSWLIALGVYLRGGQGDPSGPVDDKRRNTSE